MVGNVIYEFFKSKTSSVQFHYVKR